MPDFPRWVSYCEQAYIPQIETLANALPERLLPAFADINNEANTIQLSHYENLIKAPGDDNIDISDLLAEADVKGIEHFVIMNDLKQGIINMLAMSLYHLYEQQMIELYKGITNARLAKKAPNVIDVQNELKNRYIDTFLFDSYSDIEELRLVANTVKHAEGGSAKQLYALRPELFVPSIIRDMVGVKGHRNVRSPLFGDGFYLTQSDINNYKYALISFWKELIKSASDNT